MTTTPTHCTECNAPLSPADAQGLCPRCLLKAGLATQLIGGSISGAGVRTLVAPPEFPFDFGGYRVLRLLGRGGMGAVYEAEQRNTGRRVALKVLGHTIDSLEMRARFMREGRLAASVNHPNSVYIFGTEEIEGAPVIAMELVAGGTLRDRIRKGPLPMREAVDATLQIIAGLEAAASAGVLHRDVKPANCFVAPDGTVKVGDFGLSVSTLARHDTQLTASGVMLGTPSFAPPEQLKGDDLDVRADIYSVGATLFSLLTGKPPFDGDNVVQVVAAVLDKPAPSISSVPAELAQVVARCLAKKRDDRFPSYAALRDALLPFSGSVPEPAPIGLRAVSGFIDNAIAFLPNTLMTVLFARDLSKTWMTELSVGTAARFFGMLAFAALYFAVCESRWGATPARALFGLRVVGPDGGAPSFARALLRVAVYLLALESGALLGAIIGGTGPFQITPGGVWLSWGELGAVTFLLAFTTMRRRNGFAALHELASGTRTVARVKAPARPVLDVPAPSTPPSSEGERLGPYRVLGPLADGAWLAGYDEVLRRHVWIRRWSAGTPPLDAARREVGRAARLRWIGGARSEAANWDAFEAPPGKPLRELSAQPWAAVRGWLHDLAEEIDAATKDGTLPAEIGLDHVWVTADGRAELLDEPWPSSAPAPLFACHEPAAVQRFLRAVADAALDRTSLPLHAHDFLTRLTAGAFDRVSFIVGNLQSLLAKPATVSRRRRFAALALLPGAAFFASLIMALMMMTISNQKKARLGGGPGDNEWRKLQVAIATYAMTRGESAPDKSQLIPSGVRNPETKAMAADFISGHFGERINRPTFDREAEAAGLNPRERELAKLAVTERPHVPPERLKRADMAFGPAMRMTEDFGRKMVPMIGPAMFAFFMLALGFGSVAGSLILGFAPMLHAFGLAVVDASGKPAGRGRLLGRALLAWGLPLASTCFLLAARFLSLPPQFFIWATVLAAVAFLIGAPWIVLHPNVGPHDRLAGTRVVPR